MKMKNILIALSVIFALANSCKKSTDENPPPSNNDTIKEPVEPPPPPVLPDSLREDNLLMGNPSNAEVNVLMNTNYLVVKPQFTLSYNSPKGGPNWVSWHSSKGWKGSEPRCNCFNTDYSLPTSFYRTASYDYTGTGYDRGHLCPSDDRDSTTTDNTTTFLMSNILPQVPNLNQHCWNGLENYCTSLIENNQYELYIVAGGYGSGGVDSAGTTYTLANGNVNIPAYCWKVIVVLPSGSNDLSRITTSTRVIAVIMPNNSNVGTSNTWGQYRVTVNDIETATGYNFLSSLTASLQTTLESAVDTGPTQ